MVLLLSSIFFALLLVSFVVVFLTMRTSAEQQLLETRLAAVATTLFGRPSGASPGMLLRPGVAETNPGPATALRNLRGMQALQRLVYQSLGHHRIAPTMLTVLVLGLGVFTGVYLLTDMFPLAVMGAVLVAVLPLVRLHRLRLRRVKRFEAVLPDAIDLCSRALHAGHSLVAAIGVVAEQGPEPVRGAFAEIFRKQNYGLPLRDALLELLETMPSGDLRVFVTGVLVQKDTGGNLTEIFDRLVHVIRERLRIAGEIRVHTAQGRMTAWILTLLPPTLLLAINLIDPGYSRPMFEDPTGRKLMYAGASLLLVGGIVVRRIVNGIEI